MQIADFVQGRALQIFALLLFLLLLAASELGFRFGVRRAVRTPPEERGEMATVQAAMLGLLGLLLGFTFAMAVTRHDARRELKLREVNAMRTAAMRGQLLPEPHRTTVAPLFHAYVDARLDEFRHENKGRTVPRLKEQTHAIEMALWNEAVSATQFDGRSVAAGLFVESLNTMVETREHRRAVVLNRVPASVVVLLSLAALIAIFSVGVGYGYTNSPGRFSRFVLSVLIALVVATIVDLDRPAGGFIRSSDETLRELQELLR